MAALLDRNTGGLAAGANNSEWLRRAPGLVVVEHVFTSTTFTTSDCIVFFKAPFTFLRPAKWFVTCEQLDTNGAPTLTFDVGILNSTTNPTGTNPSYTWAVNVSTLGRATPSSTVEDSTGWCALDRTHGIIRYWREYQVAMRHAVIRQQENDYGRVVRAVVTDPMHPEVKAVLTSIGHVSDRITGMQATIEDMPRQMREAVHQGAIDAVRDLQRQARDQAGGWLLGGVRSTLSRIGWLLVAVMVVWMIGGPGALVAFLKSIFVSGSVP